MMNNNAIEHVRTQHMAMSAGTTRFRYTYCPASCARTSRFWELPHSSQVELLDGYVWLSPNYYTRKNGTNIHANIVCDGTGSLKRVWASPLRVLWSQRSMRNTEHQHTHL